MANESKHPPISHVVGGYLRRRRLDKGLTGRDVGRLLNISQQQVSRYERGSNRMTLDFLMTYLDTLGLRYEDFMVYFLYELRRGDIEADIASVELTQQLHTKRSSQSGSWDTP
ncbi:DNA-binding helix-turn-helix protein [Providencia rettgeri DSM 1131]|uniref:helix-turn-helix domain-containing protein n=1 Tax=Providencia rettgeri TaxID=587 RepID=UPI000197C010|nr:helix-turn-helix transcriptional regulator [Providencia rettgeri]EFE54101.1 DNA-binding helix-turn-helix protein [Providencia rettgeri DSM 1131]QXA57396.1 helix-turn-helix domain-containing protein [Providencia rettgeri]